MGKKKHGIFDYSDRDTSVFDKRNNYKYGVEYKDIKEYSDALNTIGVFKEVKSSYGTIKTTFQEEAFKEKVLAVLMCEPEDVKITNLSLDTSTGYFISKFF